MSKFKVGDKVRMTDPRVESDAPTGTTGVITSKRGTSSQSHGEMWNIKWEGDDYVYGTDDQLELVENFRQFKKGDLVKIIKRLPGNTFGASPECYEPNGFVGRTGYVNLDNYGDGSAQVWSEREGKGKYLGIFTPEELEFVAVQVLPTCSVYKGNYERLICDYGFALAPFIKYQPTNKPIMKTLTTMMQKLLDAPTQTLVKAGYINGDLELTNEGNDALMAILFVANKDALVADAQAKFDAEKK